MTVKLSKNKKFFVIRNSIDERLTIVLRLYESTSIETSRYDAVSEICFTKYYFIR